MAGITLEQAQAKLDGWMEAEEAVMTSQQYTAAGGRQLTRADLGEIRASITYWENKVIRLSNGGIRIMGATPL